MTYLIGFVFLLLGIWQFAMTWRTFTRLKKAGNKNTSPFIMLSLWSSLAFSIVFFTTAVFTFS